jgi:hypothetical protein
MRRYFLNEVRISLFLALTHSGSDFFDEDIEKHLTFFGAICQ